MACSTVDYKSNLSSSTRFPSINNSKISLLTYNIKAIYEKEDDQIDSLMSFVNTGGFDFVVFQELFDESTREHIINKADAGNFNTFVSRVDYNSFPEFIFQDAGLFMMSKYSRVDLSNIDFGCEIKKSNGVIHRILEKEISSTNDFLANKSVLGALFQINDSSKLFLFTAHVQAAGTLEHKLYQLEQIGDFVTKAVEETIQTGVVKYPDNLTVVLAGDFNSNAYDIDRFNSFIKALDYPKDIHKEFHGNFEEYSFRNRRRRYDYVLAYDRIGNYELNKISTKAINVVNVQDGKGENISDHKGIKATISLKQNVLTGKNLPKLNEQSGK
jgi:endonuclease/exonuclease/phosphatase family metal-dependent hydrolase